MRIVVDRPPNFWEIAEVFPIVLTKKGILYAWDGIVYAPDGGKIPQWLMDHETVHRHQQNGDPVSWWDNYLKHKYFRFQNELEAHQREWQSYQGLFKDRNQRNSFLHQIALRLSGELYGGLTNYKEARNLIQTGCS